MKAASANINRQKENFQFLGNSIKDRNTPKKLNKATLEISNTEVSPSPIKLKSLSQSNKDQLASFLSDKLISPSLSHKGQLPNFLNDQNQIISPSLSSANQIPNFIANKDAFTSPPLPSKAIDSSFLSYQTPVDSPSTVTKDQKQNLEIDPKMITTPQSLTDSQSSNYEMKYKKARQKIKGMKIIIDILNARVQKTVTNRQDLEKQIADLKQQLYEQTQSQISNNNSTLKSITVVSDAQSRPASEIGSQSSFSIKNGDQDRINNVFDKISHFEKTCDSAIQAFNEFHSLISSPGTVPNQSYNLSITNKDMKLNQESPRPPIPNKSSFSNTSTPNSSQIGQNFELLKKKNKQLQAKIDENADTITQLNAKIRRRENENSMLKQQINDLENSFNLTKKNYDSKQKKAYEYLHGLQQRFNKMPKEGIAANKNSDIIQILKENEALSQRVKELSMKNSELVRIIYKMQKEGGQDENKSSNNSQIKNDSTASPKIEKPTSKPVDSLKSDIDKVAIPMSVKYTFNQDIEEKNKDDDDDSGVSCFVE